MARVTQNAQFTGTGSAVFRFLVPALCIATVALVTSVLCSKLSLGSSPFKEWVEQDAMAAPAKTSVTLSHLQVAGSWAASALIVNVIFILTTGFCIFVVWQNLSFLPILRRRTALTALLAAAGLFSFFTVKGRGTMPAFVQLSDALVAFEQQGTDQGGSDDFGIRGAATFFGMMMNAREQIIHKTINGNNFT